MSNLRNKIIRLAHEKPELRKDLLPLVKTAASAWDLDHFIGKADERKGRVTVSLRATAKRRLMDPDEVAWISESIQDIGEIISRDHGQGDRLSGGPYVTAEGGKVTVSAAIFIDLGSTDHPTGKWLKGWHLK